MRGIININENYYECGTIKDSPKNIYIYDSKLRSTLPALPELKLSPYVVFDNFLGVYTLTYATTNHDINVFNTHLYPYTTIERLYGAQNHLAIFNDTLKQSYKSVKIPKYRLAKYLPYSFGIEYETSMGAIPEEECYAKGLIPLRDGSITGIEYSTTVLQNNFGCHMVKEQMDVLNKYTYFNKECALHIHFGNFPVDSQAILAINNLCSFLPNLCYAITPRASFHTSRYKANQKDYCSPLQWFNNFQDLYKAYVNIPFFGDLYQPHPADIDKKAKWNIRSRYKSCNLINMLCYDKAKTIEFRFLRPTRNVHIIYFWLYTLNAILQFAEMTKNLTINQMYDLYSSIDLTSIYTQVYPDDIVKSLNIAIQDLSTIRTNQTNNNDICGADIIFEENFKLLDNLIYE